MKKPAISIVVVALAFNALAGCNNPRNGGEPPASGRTAAPPATPIPTPSYKIAGRRATAKHNLIEVRVTPGTPNATLAQWSRDIVKANQNKKNLQVNFYDGPPSNITLIARYENGRLFDPLRPNRILVPPQQ